MNVLMTIDGVKTPVVFNNVQNAIALVSMQFSEDSESTTQAISVSKVIDPATPQIFALAQSKQASKVTFYLYEDSLQDALILQTTNGKISLWMLNFAEEKGREVFTVEADSVIFQPSK